MSEHQQSKPVESIVTSDSVHSKGSIPKNLRGISVGLVVIIVLVVAGILFKIYLYDVAPKPIPSTGSQSSSLLKPEQQVQNAQAELKNASTSSQKAVAYDDLGSAQLNNNQASSAISAYQSAVTIDNSSIDKIVALEGLGYAYNMSGQNSLAISSFQEVIKLLPQLSDSNDPSPAQAISMYQNIIQRLQAGEPI
ncbi:MAG: tetratricopeptide repeat protein [Candidatus Saccharimonadales bacterium]